MLLLSMAFAADRVESSETLAMGRNAVANPWSNSAIAANPAAIGLVARYHVGVAASYGQRGFHWNITAADSRTAEGVGFGVTYSGDRYNPPLETWELPGWSVPGQAITNKKRNQDLGAALSIPLFQRRIAVGAGGSVSFYDHERQGRGRAGNLSFGLGALPHPKLALGLSGRNVLALPDPNQDRPMELLAGLFYGDLQTATFAAEMGIRPESARPLVLGAGLEGTPSEGAKLRGGWRLEEGVHAVTLGAGAGTEAGSLDLGIAIPAVSFLQPADWTVQLSVRFEGPDPDAIRPE